jgi:hypothetical protein
LKTPLAVLVLAAGLPSLAAAQTSPFLPDPLHRDLVNEISGDRAIENDRWLTHYHRTGGSRDFFAAAEWIRKAAAAAGLQDVRLVRQAYKGHSWSCNGGEAWLVAPDVMRLASYGEVALSVADHSRTTHVTAPLVDVGAGTAEADYAGKDVKGRIVLAAGPLPAAHREAVWKRGALGVLSHATNRPDPMDAPDQVAWGRLPFEAKDVEGVEDGTPSTFAVMISPRRGRMLQKRLAAKDAPLLEVKVDIDAAFLERPEQAYVEGWIRGSEVRDQQIVLTAHIQEEMTSANDDGSGCANLLEIGRALTRLIAEGKLKRPRRDIRFWWVNEFASQEQFFRENPGEPARMLLNVNQDMVGARQSMGSRVQYASRLPWSLPHALDDVMENVLLTVRDGNTSVLTTRGTAHPQPFTREILAVKGSREPYHARMVPYHGSTDHHAFTPAHIGVPGTSLTNWPDEFIHSTGDDLEQVDATQLERNAVVVAAVALYFAGLDDAGAPALAAYVAARAEGRLAGELATGIAHVAEAAAEDRPAAYRAARNLLRHAHRREAAALASVPRMAPRSRAGDLVALRSADLAEQATRDLRVLDQAWTAMTGSAVPAPARTAEEDDLAGLVYTRTKDVGAWQDAIARVKPVEGLHAMMHFETWNFADGRSALEVYDAVAAEALSAGRWYYGRPTPADVREALDRATKAGGFTVSRRP